MPTGGGSGGGSGGSGGGSPKQHTEDASPKHSIGDYVSKAFGASGGGSAVDVAKAQATVHAMSPLG